MESSLDMVEKPEVAAAFVLRLYITGGSPRSNGAIRNVRTLCEDYLGDSCDLEVIDIEQEPWLARDAQIVAAPTLVKELPLPLRRFIGALSDIEGILQALGVKPRLETRRNRP